MKWRAKAPPAPTMPTDNPTRSPSRSVAQRAETVGHRLDELLEAARSEARGFLLVEALAVAIAREKVRRGQPAGQRRHDDGAIGEAAPDFGLQQIVRLAALGHPERVTETERREAERIRRTC